MNAKSTIVALIAIIALALPLLISIGDAVTAKTEVTCTKQNIIAQATMPQAQLCAKQTTGGLTGKVSYSDYLIMMEQ